MTHATEKLLFAYWNDRGNWGGTPMVGGNVGGSAEDRGNLTDLKNKGLVATFGSDGATFVMFTDLGVAYCNDLHVHAFHKTTLKCRCGASKQHDAVWRKTA